MLTAKQQEIFEYIEKHRRESGVLPSFRKIAVAFGFHVYAAKQHVDAIIKKGFLQSRSPQTTSYILPERGEGFAAGEDASRVTLGFQLPLLGDIAAGAPTFSAETIGRHVQVSPEYFAISPKEAQDLFALEVSGDSMLGDGICSGDLAIIHRRCEYDPRKIYALRIDADEFTLKRVEKKPGGKTLSLVPSNSAYAIKKFPAHRVEVVGKCIGIVRKMGR
jgi:repressor LexA